MSLSVSPELSYTTRDNIVVPSAAAGETRTAVQVRDTALAQLAVADTLFGGSNGPAQAQVFPTGLAVVVEADDEKFTLASHGLAVGDAIKIVSLAGGTGLTVGTIYYVNNVVSSSVFTVSATPGGSNVNITVDATLGTTVVKVASIDSPLRALGAPVVVSLGSPAKEV